MRQDLEHYTEAYGIPSQWPTNPWQQMAAEHTQDKLLLETQVPPDLPTVLNNMCHGLTKHALEHL